MRFKNCKKIENYDCMCLKILCKWEIIFYIYLLIKNLVLHFIFKTVAKETLLFYTCIFLSCDVNSISMRYKGFSFFTWFWDCPQVSFWQKFQPPLSGCLHWLEVAYSTFSFSCDYFLYLNYETFLIFLFLA